MAPIVRPYEQQQMLPPELLGHSLNGTRSPARPLRDRRILSTLLRYNVPQVAATRSTPPS